MSFSIAATSRNAALDGALNALNSGTLKLYAGTVPTNADASLGAATLLATVSFAATAFSNATGGTKTANALTAAAASASGTASFFRAFDSGGNLVCQGTAGTTGTDLILASTSIVSGASVSITSFVATFSA